MTNAQTTLKVTDKKAQTALDNFIKACDVRAQYILNNTTSAKLKTDEQRKKSADKFVTEQKAMTLHAVKFALENSIDFEALNKKIALCEKSSTNDSNFIAIYALQKIRKMLVALSQNIAQSADSYSHTILFNLLHSNKQSTKTALVSLSRDIEFNETDLQDRILKRYMCDKSTAQTQASSTRMMLLHLDIATVTKRKVNDVYVIKSDSAIAQACYKTFNVERKDKE